MHKLLVIFLGITFASVSYAGQSLCQAKEQVIFSCRIKSSPKIISLCGSPNLTWDEGYLQYRFGTAARIEFIFPTSKVNTQNQFKWETHRPYQSFSKNLWFRNGGYVYTVFSDELSEELVGTPGGKHEYGVNVFKAGDENWKRTFQCEHEPVGIFDLGNIISE